MPITFTNPYPSEIEKLEKEVENLRRVGQPWLVDKHLNPRLKRLEELRTNPRYTLPTQLGGRYAEIANTGIFGESGVRKMLEGYRSASAVDRRKMAAGMKRANARRLGPRSGATRQIIANRVQAPGLRDLASKRSELNLANLRSKYEGLKQLQNMLNFFEGRYQFDEDMKLQKKKLDAYLKELENQEGGFLGTIGDIAGLIPGIGEGVDVLKNL